LAAPADTIELNGCTVLLTLPLLERIGVPTGPPRRGAHGATLAITLGAGRQVMRGHRRSSARKPLDQGSSGG
jgi:hypothetical protein